MMYARYAHVVTGHIFYDNGPDETIRYVYDVVEDKIIGADILRSLGWKALEELACLDILECVRQHGLEELASVADVEMSDCILLWD